MLNLFGCYESSFKWYQSLNHKIYMLKIMIIACVVIIFDVGCKCCVNKMAKKGLGSASLPLRHLLNGLKVTKVPPHQLKCLLITLWCRFSAEEAPQCLFLPLDNIFNLVFDLQINITCNSCIYLLDIHLRVDHGLRLHPIVCNN